jgi:Sec-independent protein translocase protein TatA
VPFLRVIFSTAPLNPAQWVVLLLCPLLVLGAEEVRKAMVKGRS